MGIRRCGSSRFVRHRHIEKVRRTTRSAADRIHSHSPKARSQPLISWRYIHRQDKLNSTSCTSLTTHQPSPSTAVKSSSKETTAKSSACHTSASQLTCIKISQTCSNPTLRSGLLPGPAQFLKTSQISHSMSIPARRTFFGRIIQWTSPRPNSDSLSSTHLTWSGNGYTPLPSVKTCISARRPARQAVD